jgi:UPF0755 protein
MARLFRFFCSLVFLGLIACVIGLSVLLVRARMPGPLTAEKLVVIEAGSGVEKIAATLRDNDVINSRAAFLFTVVLGGDLGGMKAGEYAFPARIPAHLVARKIANGDVYPRKITIPEGLTSFEIVELLKSNDGLSGDVAQVPVDGALLPETYHFTRGTTRTALLNRMIVAMNAEVEKAWATRPQNFKLTKPQVITLASIVEKETGVANERPLVAGVFHNRLNAGMKLQSDPTVIYALMGGQGPLPRALTTRDLERTDNPYNTYMYAGLPPGAIANPGRDAIHAVINPAATDAFYFVADGTGGHAFARTLAEHNANVARWRAIQKQQAAPAKETP